MEGAVAKVNRKLVSLSEQNLVDCVSIVIMDRSLGGIYLRTLGCNGGMPYEAFEWIIENGGINTDKDYPYKARQSSCSFNKTKSTYRIKTYYAVNRQDEDDLTEKIATEGPISVVIDAGYNFLHYEAGVYYEPRCNPHLTVAPTHAVLVVGYGIEDGQDFYWVKNSWGEHWGENGYIKMSRNRNNNCGIATSAYWPVAEDYSKAVGTNVYSILTFLSPILMGVQYTTCWSKWSM